MKASSSPKFIFNTAIRYIFLLIMVLFVNYSESAYNLLLILTIHPVNAIISLFSSSTVYSAFILNNTLVIELIPACIAVSAYILLAMLNLTTPMNIRKRAYSLIFSLICLLILNIVRILFLSYLLINNLPNFEIIHEILWYGLSIIMVLFVWFLTTYIFKIKNIPVYTDFKQIIKEYKTKNAKRNI